MLEKPFCHTLMLPANHAILSVIIRQTSGEISMYRLARPALLTLPLLLIAYCLLLIAYCLLLIAYCLLHVVVAVAVGQQTHLQIPH